MIMTPEVRTILGQMVNGTGNILVNSTAGSGKTTLILESMQYLSPDDTKLLCSFTNKITDELKERVFKERIENCTVSTLNSLGWQAVKSRYEVRRPCKYKTGIHLGDLYYPKWRDNDDQKKGFFKHVKFMERMVGILKGYLIHPDQVADKWEELSIFHSIEKPETEHLDEMIARVYKSIWFDRENFDFDDMKLVPVIDRLPMPKFDWVYEDEAQDSNLCDYELLRMVGHASSRYVFVGDDEQAIYLFRGACNDALDRATSLFNCTELGLTVCWRCPDSHIREAQTVSSKITAPSPNPKGEGILEWVEAEEFDPKDAAYCLSRTTAVAVQECLQTIRKGKKASVLGREIIESLTDLIDKVVEKNGIDPNSGRGLEQFKQHLEDYAIEEVGRLSRLGYDSSAEQLQDRCDTILAFVQDSKSIKEIGFRLSQIFTDKEDDGILFMTIHKAKGLTHNIVYFLDEGNCPHPSAKTPQAQAQEQHLRFIALTRSTSELYIVRSRRRKRSGD